MKHTMLLMLAAASACTASAQKADDAVYVTTAAKDTVAVNINPHLSVSGGAIVSIAIDGKTIKAIPVDEKGVTLTFGPELLMGDVNRDGKVTMEDAELITDSFVGKDDVKIDQNRADMNLDGKITVNDANRVVQEVLREKE